MRDCKAELVACFINNKPELYLFGFNEYDMDQTDFSEKSTTLILAKRITHSMLSEKLWDVLHSMFEDKYGPHFVRTLGDDTTRWSDIRIVALFHGHRNYPKYLLDDAGDLYEVIDRCFPFRTIEAQGIIEPFEDE